MSFLYEVALHGDALSLELSLNLMSSCIISRVS